MVLLGFIVWLCCGVLFIMVGCGKGKYISDYEALVCGWDTVSGKVWLCDDCLNLTLLSINRLKQPLKEEGFIFNN